MDFVEQHWGLAMAQRLIDDVQPASGGVYTAVGNYDAGELVALAKRLAELGGVELPELLRQFGHHMLGCFTRRYAVFFDAAPGALAFLAGIEDHIHVEVRKLYPDAELPRFRYPERSDRHLVMDYRSARPLAHFALGPIEATIAHYGEPLTVHFEDLSGGQGSAARFRIQRDDPAP